MEPKISHGGAYTVDDKGNVTLVERTGVQIDIVDPEQKAEKTEEKKRRKAVNVEEESKGE